MSKLKFGPTMSATGIVVVGGLRETIEWQRRYGLPIEYIGQMKMVEPNVWEMYVYFSDEGTRDRILGEQNREQ